MTKAGTYTVKLRACNAQSLCGEGLIGVCVGSQCKVTNPFNAITDQNYQASAITAPTQGGKLKNGEMATATWDKTKLAGTTVYLYVLHDDPSKLVDGNATSFKNAQWHLFASVANTGSTTFDPALMQATGNAYRLLVVDETGRWAVNQACGHYGLPLRIARRPQQVGGWQRHQLQKRPVVFVCKRSQYWLHDL